VRDLWLRTGLAPTVLERLADGDVFGSLGLCRRDALWAVKALGRTGDDDNLPLFIGAAQARVRQEPDARLPPMPLGEEVVNDYRFLRLSLKAHPVQFLRQQLQARGVVAHGTLGDLTPGRRVAVAGLVLVRQRPGSAKGVIFMTLEDESGVANTIVWPKVFERFRPVVLGARLVILRGKLQSEHGVIHVVADAIEDATDMLETIASEGGQVGVLAHADEVKRPQGDVRDKRVDAQAARAARMAEIKRIAARTGGRSAYKPTDGAGALPLFSAADLDVPARATRHVMPRGRNFR
jgi:error-prone DNA polymerase